MVKFVCLIKKNSKNKKKHHIDVHGADVPMKLQMLDIIKTNGHTHRKGTESVVHQTMPSQLNRRAEGSGTTGALYWMLAEGPQYIMGLVGGWFGAGV